LALSVLSSIHLYFIIGQSVRASLTLFRPWAEF
jgi:hypothetical protein